MKRIKLLIYFLILLLIIQPGCTAIGYQTGKALDEKYPKRDPYHRIRDMERGDVVELSLNDGSVRLGKVAYYEIDKFVGLVEIEYDFNKWTYDEMQIYKWADISEIRKLTDRDIFRLIFCLTGLGVDLYIIYYILALWAAGVVASGIS